MIKQKYEIIVNSGKVKEKIRVLLNKAISLDVRPTDSKNIALTMDNDGVNTCIGLIIYSAISKFPKIKIPANGVIAVYMTDIFGRKYEIKPDEESNEFYIKEESVKNIYDGDFETAVKLVADHFIENYCKVVNNKFVPVSYVKNGFFLFINKFFPNIWTNSLYNHDYILTRLEESGVLKYTNNINGKSVPFYGLELQFNKLSDDIGRDKVGQLRSMHIA